MNAAAPASVVPDRGGQAGHWDALRRQPYWRGCVALCSRATPQSHLDFLLQHQVDYLVTGDQCVDLRAALRS